MILTGTRFMEISTGRTVSGYGTTTKVWEVAEYLGNEKYKCKILSNDTVMSVNLDYTENFSETEINKHLNQ